jgi:hypothetical protein
MIFNVSSTNAGQTNFNFLADVYVSGILVSRLTFPKQPGVNTINIDISPVMKNYITYDIENVYSTIWASNLNSKSAYYVQFGEVYGSTPTIYANLTRNPTSGSKYAYNSIFDFEEFTPTVLQNYTVDTIGFLQNNPENITIKNGQDVFLSYYDPNQIVVNMYLSTTGAAPIITTTTSSGSNYGFNLGIKWSNLSSIASQILVNGFYDISLYDIGGDPITTTRVIVESCFDKYDIYRLMWLNNMGGWESFNFDKVSIQNYGIDRKQFKKPTPLGYDVNDRLKTNYNTTITESIRVTSNWITDDQAEWIQGLLTSPIVLLDKGNGIRIPINITDSNYEVRKYLNGRQLHNLALTFEYSYNNYRQSL